MAFPRKKLGLLISSLPDSPQFRQGIRLAEVALAEGVDVYLYCIDDAVTGVGGEKLQNLKNRGLKLFACAYGAHRRNFPLSDQATFAGLTVVSDLIAGTDRFLNFN
ncbi:MAG: DsrE family protein [Verrucomicrobiota bacterium]